jgi:carbon storage regulator
MLVLSRRPGEEIIISNNIRITVVAVKGDRVRIGISAPANVPVDRAEIHARRMQFLDIPAKPASEAESDSAVGLGDMPVTVRSTGDTAIH